MNSLLTIQGAALEVGALVSGSLRLNVKTRELSQFGLAGVERAEVGCAWHERSRHVENVEAPAADGWSVVL